MKKLLLGSLLFLGLGAKAKAEELCTDWGRLDLCLPIASGITAGFGFDFESNQSQALAETPFSSFSINDESKLVFTFGAVTTDDSGAPFIGVNYGLKGIKNPIPGITDINPGLYAGKNWDDGTFFWGVKASVLLFK